MPEGDHIRPQGEVLLMRRNRRNRQEDMSHLPRFWTCDERQRFLPDGLHLPHLRRNWSYNRESVCLVPRNGNGDEDRKARGKGDAGTNGGADGDLILFISVRPDKYFVREGSDVYLQIPVAVTQAALGASVLVPTVDGVNIKVDIPAGIQSGTMLRVKGRGIPSPRGNQRGDMYLRVLVETPRRLSMKAKELMKELAGELKETTSPTPMEFQE